MSKTAATARGARPCHCGTNPGTRSPLIPTFPAHSLSFLLRFSCFFLMPPLPQTPLLPSISFLPFFFYHKSLLLPNFLVVTRCSFFDEENYIGTRKNKNELNSNMGVSLNVASVFLSLPPGSPSPWTCPREQAWKTMVKPSGLGQKPACSCRQWGSCPPASGHSLWSVERSRMDEESRP